MSRLVGIDLGSHSVKIALANPGFRHATPLEVIERPVPPGPEPVEERAARVVKEVFAERRLEHDTPFAAVRGELVLSRVLEFGFKTLRRQDLEKAVGGELEGTMPFELEDLVYDFEALGRWAVAPAAGAAAPAAVAPGAEVTDDEPTFVGGQKTDDGRPARGLTAPPTTGMRVLACAANKERVRAYLDLLGKQGAQPRALVVAATSLARVAERLGLGAVGAPAAAIIDYGCSTTQVCVVSEGRVAFVRTLGRGGRDVTDAIGRAWQMQPEEAERAKQTDGFIGSNAEPPPGDAWYRVHEVVASEIGPLARDLRQTLRLCRAETGVVPASVVLVGGASRLRGLANYMAEQLAMPVRTLDAADAERIFGAKLAASGMSADTGCLAFAVAAEGGSGRPAFNLRQGELAFKADLSFLRAKAMQIAAIALVVIAFAAGNAYASLYRLRKSEAALDERLAKESQAAFGQPMEAWEIADKAQPKKRDESPIPQWTAYDVLLELSNRLPARKEVTLDVSDIDLKAGKVTIRATTASTAEIEAIKKKLREQKCFEDVSEGSIQAGANDVKSFSLSVKTTCF